MMVRFLNWVENREWLSSAIPPCVGMTKTGWFACAIPPAVGMTKTGWFESAIPPAVGMTKDAKGEFERCSCAIPTADGMTKDKERKIKVHYVIPTQGGIALND